ncbi:unnamed protein product, partial [Rotaria magnacalcarata]
MFFNQVESTEVKCGRTFGSTTISASDWFNNERLDQYIQ